MKKVDPLIRIGLVGSGDVLYNQGLDIPSPKGGGKWISTVVPALKGMYDFWVWHYYDGDANRLWPGDKRFVKGGLNLAFPDEKEYFRWQLGCAEFEGVKALQTVEQTLVAKNGGDPVPIWITEYQRRVPWVWGPDPVLQTYNLLSGLTLANMVMVHIQNPFIEGAQVCGFTAGGEGTIYSSVNGTLDGIRITGMKYVPEKTLRHPMHWALAMLSASFRQDGVILQPDVKCDMYSQGRHTLPLLKAVAIQTKDKSRIEVIILNRELEHRVECTLKMPDIPLAVTSVCGEELNSWDPQSPEPLLDNNLTSKKVYIQAIPAPQIHGKTMVTSLAPHSLTRFRIEIK